MGHSISNQQKIKRDPSRFFGEVRGRIWESERGGGGSWGEKHSYIPILIAVPDAWADPVKKICA